MSHTGFRAGIYFRRLHIEDIKSNGSYFHTVPARNVGYKPLPFVRTKSSKAIQIDKSSSLLAGANFLRSGEMQYSVKSWALLVASFLFLLLSCELAAAQKLIHVPAEAPTIQQAIDEAQSGDTVVVSPGTYDENLDFKGKSIVVTSESSSSGGGAAHTVILGSDGPTVSFQGNEPSTAVLNGFTVGHQSPGGQTRPGEGIFISGASPTITGNVIDENNGCGVSITGPSSSPAIRGNEISWNFGGVPSANPSCGTLKYPLTIGIGIGIFAADSVEIANNTIQGNNTISQTSTAGGGIFAFQATKLVIANNVICCNTNVQQGAGGSDRGGGGGGGISVSGIGDLELIQNLVYSNIVLGGGATAGIGVGPANPESPLASGILTIINNTAVGNIGPTMSPEQLGIDAFPVQSTVENNILESTDNGIAIYCTPGATISFSFNDVIGSTPIHGCGGSNNTSVSPQFVNATGNDFHLSAASPLIAAGDITAPDIPAKDLDGLPRTINGTISLGVYEYQPVTAGTPVLTSSVNPSYVAQPVTFTATLDSSSAKSPVTGTMSFRDGAATLGIASVSAAGVATWTTNALAAGSHSVYALYSGDPALSPGITNAINQTVSKYTTAATLSASQSTISYGQSITFTVDVESPASTAPVTGEVVLQDGTNVLGVATLHNGTASFTTNQLATGTHTITAEFDQNQTYTASTSSAVTVTVASNFNISATPTSQSINLGKAARFGISVTSDSGFNSPVALSCSGLPAGASCIFSPAILASGTGTSQMVIQTAATRTATTGAPSRFFKASKLLVGMPLLCLFIFIPCGWRRSGLLVMILLVCLIPFTGCGTSQLLSLGPPQTYPIVVTGTDNNMNGLLTHSTTVVLKLRSSF